MLIIYRQQIINHVYYLTKTFAFYIYRQKQILLGHWPSQIKRLKNTKKHKSDKTLKPIINHNIYSFTVSGHQTVPVPEECPTKETLPEQPYPHLFPQAIQPHHDHDLGRRGVAGPGGPARVGDHLGGHGYFGVLDVSASQPSISGPN